MIHKTSAFSRDIQVFADKVKLNSSTVVRKVLLDMSSAIIDRSPVDTGRFRANWQYSVDQPTANPVDALDPAGDQAKQLISTQVLTGPMVGHVHYLMNNLPYGPVLEYGLYPNPAKLGSKKRGESEFTIHTSGGYSLQAPAGMVRITVTEYQGYVNDAASKL